MTQAASGSSWVASHGLPRPPVVGSEAIITPAGSTIEPVDGGGYTVCDAGRHCRRVDNLWEAQQMIQWAEVHHRPLDTSLDRIEFRS